MQKLLVSDVFGRTEALESIASELSGVTDIFDPYNAIKMGFISEVDAYSYFTSEVGIIKYSENFVEVVKSY